MMSVENITTVFDWLTLHGFNCTLQLIPDATGESKYIARIVENDRRGKALALFYADNLLAAKGDTIQDALNALNAKCVVKQGDV